MLRFENYELLDAYLQKIDTDMRKEKVPIPARQLQALSRISTENSGMEFNITLAMELSEDQIQGFEGHALTRRIIDWFEEFYGNRLKVNFGAGKSIAILKGDPFRVHIPMVLGKVKIICDPLKMQISGDLDENGKTIVNVLDHFEDILPKFAAAISRIERHRLINEFRACTSYFHRALGIAEFANTLDVRTDLDIAVEQIMNGTSSYGISRWHSLQASEKH